MFSRSRSHLRKQSRLFCGHCNEYLSRAAFWKHRKVYYDVQNERWVTRDISEPNEQSKRARYQSSDSDKETTTDTVDAEEWPSNSSGDEEIEEAIPKEQNEGCSRENFKDILGDDEDFLTAMNDNVDGSKSDEGTAGSYEGSDTDSLDSSASSCDEVSDNESIAGEEDPDVWSDIPEDHLLQDITNDEPLPEPRQRQSSMQAVIVILQWFAYFLLFWQAACKISDNGLEWLLRFMFQFLHMIGITCNSEYLSEMVLMFPSSLYLLRKFVMFKRDDFVKFGVCPKCSSLYNLENCTRKVGGKIVSNICSNKPFKKSRECGASLAKKVILSCGKECFYPHKLYCFNSVIDQVERLLKRPGVPEMCEQWREREVNENILADVYDGGIWTDFLKYKGKDFLNVPRNLAFAINVDWFQPFKRRNDRSVGVIYLVLLNLPREQRFKWENIIVAGIVPEMSKEPKSLNTFLAPIVNELQALWKGVKLSTSSSDIPLTYRGALLLASADLPAIRFNGILGSMQVNGRSVEVQMMRKLLAGRFVWDAKFPTEFQDTFMSFFTLERNDAVESLIVKNAIALFNRACCLNLRDFQWSDLTLVSLPNSFKHFALDSDELGVLLDCYKTLYPQEEMELSFLSSVARKYSNIMLGTEKFGSKMDCRNLRSARIMASWTSSDGSIDTSAARRPGIVTFYIVHSVKINGQFNQHVFAVVWWYKFDEDQEYFGKPVQVWKLDEYEPCGPALFMPVQRIAQSLLQGRRGKLISC